MNTHSRRGTFLHIYGLRNRYPPDCKIGRGKPSLAMGTGSNSAQKAGQDEETDAMGTPPARGYASTRPRKVDLSEWQINLATG